MSACSFFDSKKVLKEEAREFIAEEVKPLVRAKVVWVLALITLLGLVVMLVSWG